MSPAELEKEIDLHLAKLKAKCIETNSLPLLSVGVMLAPSPEKGEYCFAQAKDDFTPQEMYDLLDSMREQVAAVLGVQ